MRLGLVLLALLASVAEARRRPPPPDLLDSFADAKVCNRKKTWAEMQKCLGPNVTVVREDDTAKLVATATGTTKSLRLYVLNDNLWQVTTYTGADTPMNELLGFKKIAAGYRIDHGQLMQSSATIGMAGSSVRVWLRRRLSTICFNGSTACRTIITACDAMIDGKSYWSFHGTLHEKDKMLFVVGDSSRAGSHCMPARAILRNEPVGEPLD